HGLSWSVRVNFAMAVRAILSSRSPLTKSLLDRGPGVARDSHISSGRVLVRTRAATVVVIAMCLVLVAPGSPAKADSTAILVNNVLRSISVLTPTHPTDPTKVIGVGIG